MLEKLGGYDRNGWVVFTGICNEKKHEIVGTSYKDGEQAMNNLKHDFSQQTADRLTFRVES